MRRLFLLLLTAVLALGLAAARPDAARAQDNTAVAVNLKDGASVFKFAFSVRKVMGDVVDQTNAAVAYASCTECQTVAIAIQVVLVFSDPAIVTPENIAIAINEGCTTCETLASAYQYVIGTDGWFKFSKSAWKRIVEIRKELRDLGKEDLSIEEIQARVDALAEELGQIVKTEVAAGGRGKELGNEEQVDEEAGAGGGETETTPTDTTETGTTETTETGTTTTDTTETTTTP